MKSPAGKRGGRREGAGRPPFAEPTQVRSIRFAESDLERIKKSGLSLSEFVRRAIVTALEKLKL